MKLRVHTRKTMKEIGSLLPIASCLAALLVSGGCVGATYVATGATHPAKANDCMIEVFTTEIPDRDFEVIGIVEGEGNWWKSGMQDVMPKLREQACLAGGDGIVMQSAEKHGRGSHGHPVLYAYATVIRWEGE